MASPMIFCAACQDRTPHSYAVDVNGELVFSCAADGCTRFVKLAKGTSPEGIRAYFDAHAEVNAGQVPATVVAAQAEADAADADAAVRAAFGL